MSTKFVIDTEEILKKIKEKKQLNENENVQFSYDDEKDQVRKFKINHPQLFAKFVEQFPDFEARYEQTKQQINSEKDPKKLKELEAKKERQKEFLKLRTKEIIEKEKASKKQNVQQQPVEQKPQEEISPVETHYKRFENMYGINVNVIVKILKDLETYCLKNKKMYESKGLSVYASNMQNVHFLMSLLSGGISKMLMNNESTSEESANNFSNFTNLVASVAKDVGVEQTNTQDEQENSTEQTKSEDKKEETNKVDDALSPNPIRGIEPTEKEKSFYASMPKALLQNLSKEPEKIDKNDVFSLKQPPPITKPFGTEELEKPNKKINSIVPAAYKTDVPKPNVELTQNAEKSKKQIVPPTFKTDLPVDVSQQNQVVEPAKKKRSGVKRVKKTDPKILENFASEVVSLLENDKTIIDAIVKFNEQNLPESIEIIKNKIDPEEISVKIDKLLREMPKSDAEIGVKISSKIQILNFIKSLRIPMDDSSKTKFKKSITAGQFKKQFGDDKTELERNEKLNQEFDSYVDSLSSADIVPNNNQEQEVVKEIRDFVKNFFR